MEAARAHKLFVGVDVAAATLSVAWVTPGAPVSRSITIEQTATGFANLQRHLTALGYQPQAILVVMEATGSYWMSVATTLMVAGFAVSVINPKQAHDFADALLKRAKTDAVDAQTLAQLAAMLQPTPWTPPPTIFEERQQRLAQRAALIDLRHQVRNQHHALTQKPYVVAAVRERMDSLITSFTAQIGELETEIATVLQQDDAWATAAARLQTITGIGLLSTAWLLVATLNFTLCPTPEALAASAGLVPYKWESGSSVRKRPGIGHTGHAQVRTALYLAALSASQYNPIIKPFYARLRAQGKPNKVARCAAARKLAHLAWAVATKGATFDPHYQQHGGSHAPLTLREQRAAWEAPHDSMRGLHAAVNTTVVDMPAPPRL